MKKLDDGPSSPVDLKATVTLSGDALAALLEEVKNAQARSRLDQAAAPAALAEDEITQDAGENVSPEPAKVPAAPTSGGWKSRSFRW